MSPTGFRDERGPVVLLAHGSRHPLGVASIERLRDAVATSLGSPAYAAYLDLNQPDLTATAEAIRDQGESRAVVVPLLFTPAFHARTDVPATVQAARSATGLDLKVADILGTPDELIPILLAAGSAASVPAEGELLLAAVGSSQPSANATVADLADRVAAARQDAVHPAFATCDPRVADVLSDRPQVVGIVPMFVGHGLLLDRIRTVGADRGIPVAAPLEDALSPLVLARYAAIRP
jgi:sirohydrochlorin cobaltochelatase